jgi:retinol dehydrogenase-12
MSELQGRTFLVTGATSGIGRATLEDLARRGASVVLACRSVPRAEEVAATTRRSTGNDAVWVVPMDLASLGSVRAGVESFHRLGLPLHVLVNNAGVGGARGTTSDGFELAFGTNHLGHFLLTALLLGDLRAAAPSRVVTVASASHYQARGIDFDDVRRRSRSITGLREYAVSKLCNVLFSRELALREAANGVTAASLHPGVVATEIWRRVPRPVRPLVTRRMLSPEQGARTSLYCATAPGVEEHNGAYFDDCAVRAPSPLVTPALAAALWDHSEQFVAPWL